MRVLKIFGQLCMIIPLHIVSIIIEHTWGLGYLLVHTIQLREVET